MNILEIYKKYHLPENLQMHMLRVAACASLILDNWNGEKIDKEAIIRVCLLHDMGNMVKIPEDFSKDEEFIRIRKEYFEKYMELVSNIVPLSFESSEYLNREAETLNIIKRNEHNMTEVNI